MIAALILAVSVAALLQFFVSYCRSLIAASGRQELSEQAREVTGIENHAVAGEEFPRLVQLLWLCPEPGDDANAIRAVRGYFGLLKLLRGMARRIAPGIAGWAEHEGANCAYFAAVALDRRIAHSRELLARQISNLL